MSDPIGLPRLGGDTRRLEVARERRALLYGEWEGLAYKRMRQRLGAMRVEAAGKPDLSANPFRSVCHQVAVTYDRAPRVSHPDDDADRTLASALERKLAEALWSSKMQRIQRDTIGIREMLVRVDVSERGRLVIRPVFPDRVDLVADDEEPDRPRQIVEARVRTIGGRRQWTYDTVDGVDGTYTVTDGKGDDVTVEALGAPASGDAFPYLDSTGAPYLPAVLYHAVPTGELWDYRELRELYEATLESCVLWTFWGHLVRDASWPQRWTIGLTVQGATTEGGTARPRQAVITDPATVVNFQRSDQDPGSGTIAPGQWAPGGNPLELAEALMVHEQRLAAHVGVTDPDFIRRSGDPRSGYALAISRDGQRAAARKFEPQFRAGDEELLGIVARQLNAHERELAGDERTVPELPESGWRIRYLGLPLTPEEQDARRREVLELLDRRLISRAAAYARLHELELDEARRELEEIDAEATTAGATPGATPGQAPGSGG